MRRCLTYSGCSSRVEHFPACTSSDSIPSMQIKEKGGGGFAIFSQLTSTKPWGILMEMMPGVSDKGKKKEMLEEVAFIEMGILRG